MMVGEIGIGLFWCGRNYCWTFLWWGKVPSNVFMAGCAGTHLEFGGSEKTDRRSTESSIIGKSSDLKSELLLCNENV